MNTVPRPTQIDPAVYTVELRWPRLLGGGSTHAGPFKTYRAAKRYVAAARSSYPGDQQPGATINREPIAR